MASLVSDHKTSFTSVGPPVTRVRNSSLREVAPWLPSVDLVEIYVVGTQAPEARLAARNYVLAREAHVVGALAHREANFRGENDVVPANILQGAAHDLLGGALLVDVGGVYEVATGVDEAGDHTLGTLLVQLAPERHATEAEL